ncbi:IS30 family transposase [Nocardioides sp. S5]|uniref:IS30 family transposase n=1 Tax=Nocardioides sp. S5 TaxID=2017486 RepID=UPI001A8D20D7|nr:IS30 family transposase [Nocardioides sp. S5]
MTMGRRGRKRRLGVEDEYWQLILAGVGTVEACKLVGVGRKTGYRWRAERGGLPPLRRVEHQRSDRYLSLLERQRIATLRRHGLSIREIARQLFRAPSTISRELRRNTSLHDVGGYDGDLAHSRARERVERPRGGRLATVPGLREAVQSKLELEWSPEQIAAWLRAEYPGRPRWHVCHETIYQALYSGAKGGLSRQLTKKLRTGRPLRKRRRRAQERTPRFIAPALLIDHRPAEAAERSRVGDWEGDLITGRAGQSAIGTLVCRRGRYIKLVHLPGRRTAEDLVIGLRETLAELPESVRLTLTWDQGSEMAGHDQVADLFAEGVFFAHAGKPWQRPTNENSNGLLRQYFPKGSDLRAYTVDDLRRVEERLNTRPRKTLGWITPTQVLSASLASS